MAHDLQPVQVVAGTLEHALAGAQQDRHQVDLHLINQPGAQVRTGGLGVPLILQQRADEVIE